MTVSPVHICDSVFDITVTLVIFLSMTDIVVCQDVHFLDVHVTPTMACGDCPGPTVATACLWVCLGVVQRFRV